MRAGRDRGTALVEALAALTLLAIAGAVVASAAGTNLRALRAGAVEGRLLALAARELAGMQARPPSAGSDARPLAEAELRGEVRREAVVDATARLAILTVTVEAGPPRRRVSLGTRLMLPW